MQNFGALVGNAMQEPNSLDHRALDIWGGFLQKNPTKKQKRLDAANETIYKALVCMVPYPAKEAESVCVYFETVNVSVWPFV